MPLLLDRAFLRVSGQDAIGFLDNLLTQDVARLSTGAHAYAALLTPQGKVICDMFLVVEAADDEQRVLIDVDPSRAADLMRRLNMYKLRAHVSIENITDGPDRPRKMIVPGGNTHSPELWEAMKGKLDVFDYFLFTLPAEAMDNTAVYETHRITLGVPDLARDAQPEEVFAGEALLEELNGVAFNKGCFVGQENVSRMKRRATTRKKFCPIVFDGEAPPYGTAIKAGEAEIGTVRTGVQGRAIALLRLDRALDATATVKPLTANGKEIRLDPPPWLILPQREDEV